MTMTMTRRERANGSIYLLINLFLLPALLRSGLPLVFPQITGGQLNFLYFLINFLSVGWIFRDFWKKTLTRLGDRPGALIRGVILGFLSYQLLSAQATRFILLLEPDFLNVNDQAVAGSIQENPLLMAFGTVILVPVAEEVLHRGLIFGTLAEKNLPAAYVVSILGFAAIHVMGYVGQYEPMLLLLCLLQYVPAGLCLAWAYRLTGNIAAPILIHAAVNAIGVFASR